MSTKNSEAPPLWGLILAGGPGSRMGTDKGGLEYHGAPQTQYCFDLLLPFCERAYVSNRPDQAEAAECKDLPQIHDRYPGIGPLGGILSAMAAHSDAAWLVLAVDMPLVTRDVLARLVEARDPGRLVTAYRSAVDDSPEPLCAIYEPAARDRLEAARASKMYSLRQAISPEQSKSIEPPDDASLSNVNTPEAYEATRAMLAHGTRRG